MAARIGQRVRVGGLVAALTADGFVIDDGTGTGRAVLHGEAAEFLGLIEVGDALEVIGRVDLRADVPVVSVDAAADLLRVGDLGDVATEAAAGGSPEHSPDVEPAGNAVSIPRSSANGVRSASIAWPLDPAVAGIGWVALIGAGTLIATILRRRRVRRRLAARVLQRLATLTAAPSSPDGSA